MHFGCFREVEVFFSSVSIPDYERIRLCRASRVVAKKRASARLRGFEAGIVSKRRRLVSVGRALDLRTTQRASPSPDDDLHAHIRRSRPRRGLLSRARAKARRTSRARSGAVGNQNPRALFVEPREATLARCAHGRDRRHRALERSRSRRGSQALVERSPGDGAVGRQPR
jgi:hypothetical protein